MLQRFHFYRYALRDQRQSHAVNRRVGVQAPIFARALPRNRVGDGEINARRTGGQCHCLTRHLVQRVEHLELIGLVIARNRNEAAVRPREQLEPLNFRRHQRRRHRLAIERAALLFGKALIIGHRVGQRKEIGALDRVYIRRIFNKTRQKRVLNIVAVIRDSVISRIAPRLTDHAVDAAQREIVVNARRY